MIRYLQIVSFVFLSLLVGLIYSCKKENETEEPQIGDAPVVRIIEIGVSNSNFAFLGMNFPLKATIKAPNKIREINMTILPQEGQEYTVDTIIKGDYVSLSNTEFDELIFIPPDVETGHYHVHLFVKDQQGLINIDEWSDLFLEEFK